MGYVALGYRDYVLGFFEKGAAPGYTQMVLGFFEKGRYGFPREPRKCGHGTRGAARARRALALLRCTMHRMRCKRTRCVTLRADRVRQRVNAV